MADSAWTVPEETGAGPGTEDGRAGTRRVQASTGPAAAGSWNEQDQGQLGHPHAGQGQQRSKKDVVSTPRASRPSPPGPTHATFPKGQWPLTPAPAAVGSAVGERARRVAARASTLPACVGIGGHEESVSVLLRVAPRQHVQSRGDSGLMAQPGHGDARPAFPSCKPVWPSPPL